jgi:hypothetical protein
LGSAPSSERENGNTSQAKIDANRRNAKLSTGPKSPNGKRNASRNATKHDLLAKDIVIRTGDGQEDQAEFDSLLSKLRDYYKPVGEPEDLCVRELADSYWLSARALRCERGAVTLASTIHPKLPDLTPLEEDFLPRPDSNARHSLLQTSRGINYLLEKLEETQRDVESNGFVPQKLLRFLPQNLGHIWRNASNNASNKKMLLTALENEKTELNARKLRVEAEERDERQAHIDAAAIPSKDVLDRIHRYETANRRHRYRVEKRLDELQSRRRQQEPPSEPGSAGRD